MADNYLQLAQEVIRARGKPLSAKSILAEARRFGLMPDHLTGSTMHKTLQARISDDINSHQENSQFYRVGVGTYFLRELAFDPTLPKDLLQEKPPPGRVRSIEESRILHSRTPPARSDLTIVDVSDALSWIERHNGFRYAHNRLPSETRIGTFTIVRWGRKVFLHDLGKFSYFFSEDSPEQSTIGLRRYIDEFDDDIFKAVEFGIDFSSAREVIRNVAISDETDFADDRKIRRKMNVLAAALEPSIRSLFFVVEVNLSRTRNQNILFKNRKDVRNPHWAEMESIDENRLDPLSKTIISSGLIS